MSVLRRLLVVLVVSLGLISAPIWGAMDCCGDEEQAAEQTAQDEHPGACLSAEPGAADHCGLVCLACCSCCSSMQAVIPLPAGLLAVLAPRRDAFGLFPTPGSPDPEERLQVPKAA